MHYRTVVGIPNHPFNNDEKGVAARPLLAVSGHSPFALSKLAYRRLAEYHPTKHFEVIEPMRRRVIQAHLLLFWGVSALLGQGGTSPPLRQRPTPTNFPAQQRPIADAATVNRGRNLYDINCRSCHGADLRGGELGGPNLLRSQVALNDKAGELIYPVVRDGRNTLGGSPMPSLSLPEDDVKAVAEYIHSILAATQRQGGPPPAPRPVLNVLVGDAAAGKVYFDAKCSSCHSVTGDLQNIGERFSDPVQLQNSWLAGNTVRSRENIANPVIVAVTLASGVKFQGELSRIDDFIVAVKLEDGTFRSFRRDRDTPKVEIRDPREAHRNLLPGYTDSDIHNVTAYLANLK